MGWSPPKGWTAWPLRLEDVPREGEAIGEDDGEDVFTFKKVKDEGPSADLEELLVATTLRFAREKFDAREEEGSEEMDGAEDVADGVMDGSEGEENSEEPMIKEQSEPPEPNTWLKPIISADDDRSASLLRPSIRHTLSKLDELLMSLHHARETCHQINSRSAANTNDETMSTSVPVRDDSPSPAKRPRGRPRKFADLTLLQKDSQIPTPDSAELFRAKKTHIGRPQKDYPRLPGESQAEHIIRIARIQKKPLPSFAAPRPEDPPRSPSAASRASSRSRKSPARPMTVEELRVSRKKKLGLRDWSELLGIATLVGFKPEVVERATRRCVELFGEGMVMRTLVEAPYSMKDADTVTNYLPGEIPDFGDEESFNDESDESEIDSPRKRKRNARDLEDDSWLCPLESCRMQNRAGFEFIAELRRHLKNVHEMGKDEVDELLGEEEMDGAVHVDGFLEPMRCRRGVRGEDKAPRRSKKKSGSPHFGEVDDTEGEVDDGESSSSEEDDGRVDGGSDESGSESL